MANIYSSQNEVLLQERLVDASDKDEFKFKPEGLKYKWRLGCQGITQYHEKFFYKCTKSKIQILTEDTEQRSMSMGTIV